MHGSRPKLYRVSSSITSTCMTLVDIQSIITYFTNLIYLVIRLFISKVTFTIWALLVTRHNHNNLVGMERHARHARHMHGLAGMGPSRFGTGLGSRCSHRRRTWLWLMCPCRARIARACVPRSRICFANVKDCGFPYRVVVDV